MSLNQFPTPAHTAIYIDEYHVDDAYSVRYEYQDSSGPLYTYFNKNWGSVAPGKQLVIGDCAINFRYPGYLASALLKATNKLPSRFEDAAESGGKGTVQRYLREMRHGSSAERIKLLTEAAHRGPEFLKEVSSLAALSQFAAGNLGTIGRNQTVFPDVFEAQEGWQNQVLPVDIYVHYGDINGPHTVDILKDVVFTGKSKQAQAGATAAGGMSSSGVNLLEIYSFFAKKVQQVAIDPSTI